MTFTFHESWSARARDTCERAINRHGGWSAWENLHSLKLKPLWLRGTLPYLKGYQKTFGLPEFFEVFAKERKVIFHAFPYGSSQGIFDKGDLTIIRADQIVSEIKNARITYQGLGKYKHWNTTDSLYFFGYAWTGYLSYPFVFPDFELVDSFRHRERNEIWDVLVLKFPTAFDTHCHMQTFYFDNTGLLRRNDYHAEIVGRWAMGAHYSEGYQLVNGIEVALKRRVYLRLGIHVFPITALAADLQVLP